MAGTLPVMAVTLDLWAPPVACRTAGPLIYCQECDITAGMANYPEKLLRPSALIFTLDTWNMEMSKIGSGHVDQFVAACWYVPLSNLVKKRVGLDLVYRATTDV